MVPKEEAKDQIDCLPEDLSKLLNFVPTALQQSNGQSIDVIYHNISLNILHSSLFPLQQTMAKARPLAITCLVFEKAGV